MTSNCTSSVCLYQQHLASGLVQWHNVPSPLFHRPVVVEIKMSLSQFSEDEVPLARSVFCTRDNFCSKNLEIPSMSVSCEFFKHVFDVAKHLSCITCLLSTRMQGVTSCCTRDKEFQSSHNMIPKRQSKYAFHTEACGQRDDFCYCPAVRHYDLFCFVHA